MQLKNYQKETLAVLRDYFGRLDGQTPREAYEAVTASVEMRARLGALRGYADSLDGAPLVSIKVPTGGGLDVRGQLDRAFGR